MKKLRKAILLPDIHHPFHNERAVKTVFKFMKWFQPDEVIVMGDGLEMQAINHWQQEKGNKKYFEGVRLLHDYDAFDKDILKPIEKICPKAKKTFLEGNHEFWATGLINRFPQLEGMIEPEVAMKLKERDWEWIPFIKNGRRGMIRRGKLTLVHGHYTNKFHAAKTADTYSKSVVYAHSHDRQIYTKVHIEDPNDFHSAESIGCLCDKSPEFLWGQPNRWVHAFGILYIRENGNFNLYVPVMVNGEFTYAGRTWK